MIPRPDGEITYLSFRILFKFQNPKIAYNRRGWTDGQVVLIHNPHFSERPGDKTSK